MFYRTDRFPWPPRSRISERFVPPRGRGSATRVSCLQFRVEQAWTPCDAALLLVQDRALLASRAVAPSSGTFIYVKEGMLGHLRLAVIVCRRGS